MGLLGSILFIYGCASMDDVELRMNRLRTELYSEVRNQTNNVREASRNDIKDMEGENKKDINNVRDISRKDLQDVESESKKDINNVKISLMKEIDELKHVQNKYVAETDKTSVDHQRQIFQNKALVNDLLRRVYLLESIVTSKTSVQKEGYVTFVSDDIVSISLGSANGVRAGEYFGVYKETEKIGAIKIDTVEVDSSKGVVVNKVTAISIGDRVDPEKAQ
jgi:hypothetical protein